MTKIEKAEYYYNKAEKAFNRGDYKTAKKDYEKSLELNPRFSEAYNNLALLEKEHFQEFEKARQYYEKAIELNSNNAMAYYNLACLLTRHYKEYDKARLFFEKVIKLSPSDARAYNDLALLITEHFKEYQTAKQYYEKAIEINKDYDESYNNFANLLWLQFDEYEKAKQYYEKAIGINPEFVDAYSNLATLMWQNFQEYEKAKLYYEKAIEKKPEYAKAYNDLANLLEDHWQEYETARQCYEKAIEKNPNYANAYNNLALLLTNHFQEYEKAKHYFEKAIELNPDIAITYYNLAFLLENYFKDDTRSKQFYKKARDFDPNSVKKITQITLKDYNQFKKEVQINFTYPKGHSKAGEPLDRICIIGQSGSGKSSLLELIKAYISGDKTNIPNANYTTTTLQHKTYDYQTEIKLINFPPYAVENIKHLDADEILEFKSDKIPNIIDFAISDPKKHWYPILKKIAEFQVKAIRLSAEFGNIAYKTKDINQIKIELDKYHEKIQELKKHNNSLEELNNFIEPLFSKFHLKIKTEPDNPEEIKFVPIESVSSQNNKEIKMEVQTQFLSTGTQQILSRTVPLFSLKPKNTIILIDEPENSFYPKVQKEFVDFITKENWNNGKKTCQFFFATHSPTIASSFEPWEIVELKFNNEGKVEQKLYYDGERHIDNYNIYPKYLRLDKIFSKLFDIDKESEERQKELYKLAKIQSKIDYYKKNKLKEKLSVQLELFKNIAKKLEWDINNMMP